MCRPATRLQPSFVSTSAAGSELVQGTTTSNHFSVVLHEGFGRLTSLKSKLGSVKSPLYPVGMSMDVFSVSIEYSEP